MGQLTVSNLFDKAYDATATGMKTPGYATGEPWMKLIPKLKKVVGTTFESAEHSALDDLRKALKRAVAGKQKEGEFLASGAGLGKGAATALAPAGDIARGAALKMLRHTYYHARRGNHKMWIVSLPESFDQWPHNYLKCSPQQLVARLGADSERFSATDRLHISDATQRGLGWVLKAQVLLDDVSAKSRGLRVLKRWFGDEDMSDDALRAFGQGTLRDGLKKVAAKMSAGTLIVTDFVPIRKSTDAKDLKTGRSNAFVTADTRDVVYIEPAFFTHAASSVFQKDERHWARIMVHEMTHREAKTTDKRYGWKGIRPNKTTFPSADAIVNADSWALFIANAAGAMSLTDINRALNGTVP